MKIKEKVGIYLGADNRHKHSHFIPLLINLVCSPFDLFGSNLRDHVVSSLCVKAPLRDQRELAT